MTFATGRSHITILPQRVDRRYDHASIYLCYSSQLYNVPFFSSSCKDSIDFKQREHTTHTDILSRVVITSF